MPRPVEYPVTFEAEGHRYVDGQGKCHHSVTQILKATGCVDFSMVDPVVLLAAAARGTAVHQLTVAWDNLRGLFSFTDFLKTVPEELQGYLHQYEKFLVETGFEPWPDESERPRLVEIQGHPVAMTPDRIGHFPHNPQLSILDLKTGGELFSHPLQLAAYSMGMERVLSLAMTHDRVGLYLEPDSYRLKVYRAPQDYHAFLCALEGGGPYLEEWKAQREKGLVA
jgi:hypothetical protein